MMEERLWNTAEKKTDRNLMLQDELLGAMIGLARSTDADTNPDDRTLTAELEGLLAAASNASCSDEELEAAIRKVQAEKYRLVPDCAVCQHPCGRHGDYDMNGFWTAPPEIRRLKYQVLLALRELAAYGLPLLRRGKLPEAMPLVFYRGIFSLGEDWEKEDLLEVLEDIGSGIFTCMDILDKTE